MNRSRMRFHNTLASTRLRRPGETGLRESLSKKASSIVLALALLLGPQIAVISLIFLTPDQRLVAMPALAAFCVAVLFLVRLFRLNAAPPLNEIGAYYVIAVLLYTLFPLITYLLRGMVFTNLGDARLYVNQPIPMEVGVHGWRHVAYLAAFAVIYLWRRGAHLSRPRSIIGMNRASLLTTFSVLAIIQSTLLVYSIVYGVGGGTYSERNLNQAEMSQNVPLILRQVVTHGSGILVPVKIVLLIYLFSEYRKRWMIIWIWVAAEILLTVSSLGSRSPLVLLLLSALFLYHRLVRPISPKSALAIAALGITGYLYFGLVRDYGNKINQEATVISSANEFESLFATSLDMYRRRESGSLQFVPPAVYFADFIALIPSQLLPFEKWSGAEWYLNELGLRGTGVGLTFGALSESAIGLGWIEIVLRGTLLGFLFALLHRWYVSRSSDMWVTTLYIWILILSYNSFRASSFMLLGLFWLEFLPFYLLLRLISAKRSTRKRATQYQQMPQMAR